MTDWNAGIIDEFRQNEGVVGGIFEGKPLLILEHIGAKSGAVRHSPLMYQQVDGSYAIFASKAGADTNPHWFHNVRANPDARVEIGTEVFDVTARVAEGEERDRIWTRQKVEHPQFADYEASTDRQIPVVMLEPR